MSPFEMFALTTPVFLFAVQYVGVGKEEKVQKKMQIKTVIFILCATIALEVAAIIEYYN